MYSEGVPSLHVSQAMLVRGHMKRFALIAVVLLLSGRDESSAQWTSVNTGLTNIDVSSFAVSDTNIFAGTHLAGVFLSTNYGASWTAVNTGLKDTIIYSLAVSDANIFAGTGGYYTGATHGGVYRSTNSGASWAITGLADGYAMCLAANSPIVYAGTYYDGAYLSVDNGASWTAINNDLTNFHVSALALQGSIPLAGTYGDGVFRSTNTGLSWNAANDGLTDLHLLSLAVSGANIYAGTEGGVFLSANLGMSWTAASNGLTNPYINCLAVFGADLFAGTDSGGVFLSTNSGASWTGINTGLTDTCIISLVVSGTSLFAGPHSGIYRRSLSEILPLQLASFMAQRYGTTSMQLTWTTALEIRNYGFEVQHSSDGRNFASIGGSFVPGNGTTTISHTYEYVDANPAGTSNYRLKQMDTDGTVNYSESVQPAATLAVKEQKTAAFALEQNYPNPFNPSTKIRFTIVYRQMTSVKVYDVLGREVATLMNEVKEPGTYTVEFSAKGGNGNRLASGVYVYVLKSSEGQRSGRMILSK